MEALKDLLGQPALAAELVKLLTVPNARVWLRGPSGSGKTTVTNLTTELLKPMGNVIRLSGDPGHVGTKFLAVHHALAGSRLRKPVREAMQAGITAPLKIIPFVGGAAADLARIAAASLGRAKPEFLTAEQQDILQGLQNLAARRRIFIIVDDVGWLDSDTAHLILWLSRPDIRKAFPFADGTSILFVETTDIPPIIPTILLDKLRPADVVDCKPVGRADFGRVLRTFGFARKLPETLLDEIYVISRGHLEIAKQIVKLDQGKDLASLLAAGDATSLMSELLSSRLKGIRGADALCRLLSIAAHAGSTFSEAEVRCAFMDPEAFPAALQAAYSEDLLFIEGETLRFVHEVIRAAAERLGSPQAADLHARLAACIKKLRPGDYSARLRHVRLSHDAEGRQEMAFAAAMQSVRGERIQPSIDISEIGILDRILADAKEAYRLMDEGNYRQALDIMMPHYDGADSLAQGEVVALLALNQIKRRTVDAYNEAASLLELWRERRGEIELWQRLMSILLTAWAAAGETERASQLYTVLARDLAQAAKSDPTARTRLEALNRKADMFFTSEIAVKHIARAAEWFGPAEDTEIPRHGFEYTACLTNLSGALFTCGRFIEAADSAAAAIRCVDRLRDTGLRTVESYKALNNYVVASYRAGLETPQALGAALDALTSGAEQRRLRDRSLMACNRGALALLDGRLEDGIKMLEAVWRHVSSADLDGYYLLYAGSNVAVAWALAERRDEAAQVLREIEPHLDVVPKWTKQAHRRRHAMMRQAVENRDLTTASALDDYPATIRVPDGNQDPWWSIGHGLLLSDIQVWSEG
jgi:energy-coupling factor transporter ATP-binding protein EcfA2